MKFLVLLVYCGIKILIVESKIIPENLPQPCSKSVRNYSECTYKILKKMGPDLLNGIPELNFPELTPLRIPIVVINRTLNSLVSVNAVLKNQELWGYDQLQLENFKFDLQNLSGEISMTFPHKYVSFEFEGSGRVLGILLNNTGYFQANLTNMHEILKFRLEEIDKLGVKYYTIKNFKARGTIGSGFGKIVSKNPEHQAAVDVFANFANANFHTFFNAILPIYEETVSMAYKVLLEPILSTVPAQELIPE